MSESHGERGQSGDRGVAGERGPKGDHGQHGEQGSAGPASTVEGPRGPQGATGNPATKAFIFVVCVATFVAAVATWQAFQAHDIARSNKDAIARINEQSVKIEALRKAERDSCQNFETLRAAVNEFHGTIRQLLITGRKTDLTRARNIRNPKLRAADLSAARSAARILLHTHTVDVTCAQKQPGPPPPSRTPGG